MDYMKDLHEMCETISEAISEANEKVRAAGGKLNAGDVEYVDKLTHTLKSIKSVMSMMDDEEYSGDMMPERSYRYRDGSYRSRMSGRRDSMGRYSGGYSRSGLADELRDLMREAPDEHTRQDIQRLIEKLDR